MRTLSAVLSLLVIAAAPPASGLLVRAPSGERMARAALDHEQGAVAIAYRTILYGQQTLNDIRASAKSREFHNKALPGRLAGRLTSEFALEVGGQTLAAGEHEFTLVVGVAEGADGEQPDLDFGVRFGGDGPVHPLEPGEAPSFFTHFACLLASDGAEGLGLNLFYGELAGTLRLRPAPAGAGGG